jgi:hypothetical protein
MEIKFNKPIEVSAKQYAKIMTQLKGVCAGKIENEKYFIKIWLMSWINDVKSILESEA